MESSLKAYLYLLISTVKIYFISIVSLLVTQNFASLIQNTYCPFSFEMSCIFFSISDSSVFCLRRKCLTYFFLLICLSFIEQSTFSDYQHQLQASSNWFVISFLNTKTSLPHICSVLHCCSSLFLKYFIHQTYRTLKIFAPKQDSSITLGSVYISFSFCLSVSTEPCTSEEHLSFSKQSLLDYVQSHL